MPFPYTFEFPFEEYGTDTTWIFPIVEIAFTSNPFDDTPVWNDVTGDLLNFTVRRGRQYEMDRFEAGTAR